MNQRITDEKRLADYLEHHYHLYLKKTQPIGGVLKVQTNEGTFLLKKVHSKDQERWKLIKELSICLQDRFFLPAPILTQSGRMTFDGFHHRYVLLPWIPGKSPSLVHSKDWGRLSRHLAWFHQSTKNFEPKGSAYRKYRHAGKWSAEWKNAYRQLELFQLAARWTGKPTKTDQSWLEVADYNLCLMENLLKYLEKIGGDSFVKQSTQYGQVCHGNLHRRNFVVDQSQQIFLIDWNRAILDVRARDIAQWLLYAYGKTRSRRIITNILHNYQKHSPLTDEEYSLVYLQLLYPTRLIQVLRNIYADQTLPITAGAPSIYSATKWEESKIQFIRKFVRILQEDFHVTIPQIEWLNR